MYEQWKQFIEDYHNDIKEKHMENKEEIVRNIEVLIELIKAYPQKLFDLHAFTDTKDCGTLYCSIGLAASQPYFQMKGLSLFDFDLQIRGVDYYKTRIAGDEDYLDTLFGEESFGRLFDIAGQGVFDNQHPDFDEDAAVDDWNGEGDAFPNTSDKELAIWRLEYQLARYKEPQ